jgi:hypothetical protein
MAALLGLKMTTTLTLGTDNGLKMMTILWLGSTVLQCVREWFFLSVFSCFQGCVELLSLVSCCKSMCCDCNI